MKAGKLPVAINLQSPDSHTGYMLVVQQSTVCTLAVGLLQMRQTRPTPFMIPDAVGRQLGLRDKRRIDIKLSRSHI